MKLVLTAIAIAVGVGLPLVQVATGAINSVDKNIVNASTIVYAPKPLPESKMWQGYCECMTEDQIYFAQNF